MYKTRVNFGDASFTVYEYYNGVFISELVCYMHTNNATTARWVCNTFGVTQTAVHVMRAIFDQKRCEYISKPTMPNECIIKALMTKDYVLINN